MAALVETRSAKDINWVTSAQARKPIGLFLDGKVDAFLGFPPEPQRLRAQVWAMSNREQRAVPAVVAVLLLHVPANSPEFVRTNDRSPPSAWSASDPSRDRSLRQGKPTKVARQVVDRGFTPNYDYAWSRRCRTCPMAGGATRSGGCRSSASMLCACTKPRMIRSNSR